MSSTTEKLTEYFKGKSSLKTVDDLEKDNKELSPKKKEEIKQVIETINKLKTDPNPDANQAGSVITLPATLKPEKRILVQTKDQPIIVKVPFEAEIILPVDSEIKVKPLPISGPWNRIHVPKEIRIQNPDNSPLMIFSVNPKGKLSLKIESEAVGFHNLTMKQFNQFKAGVEAIEMLIATAPLKEEE